VRVARLARQHRQQLELALGLKVRANDTDTALVGALLASFGITTESKRKGSTTRMYGADSQQLSLVRAAANRLQRKALGQAPPSAGEGASLNKTARGGAPPTAGRGAPHQQSLARPLEQGASFEQLQLAADSNGNHPVQCEAGRSASNEAAPRSEAPPPNPWRAGGRGDRAAASRR